MVSKGEQPPREPSIQINDLENDTFFYGALRKPDFQRETAEWDPKTHPYCNTGYKEQQISKGKKLVRVDASVLEGMPMVKLA